MISKIFLSLISILIFSFLVLVTYVINTNSNFQKPYYKETQLGLFELIRINSEENINNFSTEKIEKTSTGGIFIKKINISDKIIFSNGDIQNEYINGVLNISITNGIYFFDLKEITTNYIIKGKGFEIKNKGPGTFFINNISPNKNIIFSLNSILDLKLKNNKTNENIADLSLYPHTYLVFNPIKNIFVKDSDLLKISQVFNLGYFDTSIFIDNLVSKDFIKLISLKNNTLDNFIINCLLFTMQESEKRTKIIDKFIKYNTFKLPKEDLIKKYFILFINENKKDIYYKNLILKDLHDLLKSDDIDLKTINQISDNYNTLKKYNSLGTEEIKKIITYYYESVIKSNKYSYKRYYFSHLISKINNSTLHYNIKSTINLEKIFIKYDFGEKILMYNEISEFKQNYFKELNINIKGNNNTDLDLNKIDYLLFFFENILLASNSNYSEINTQNLINIFNDYLEISNYVYLHSNEKVKRTGLFTNSKIVNQFTKIIENKYFNNERNSKGLLEIKNASEIVKKDIILLENNINEIFKFYKDNILILKQNNNKDEFLIKLYSSLEEKYKEYFSALKDYKEYSVIYNSRSNKLLNENSINEDNTILSLSIDHAKNYLKQFNGVNLEYTLISIMDYNYCLYPNKKNEKLDIQIPYCYKVSNLGIDNNNISFLLHPFNKNKIDEISINNENKSGTYKLDEIKIALDDKKKFDLKNSDKYVFNNFLSFIFGNEKTSSNKIIKTKNTKKEILVENPVVKIFKRNKLLGNSGDFKNLYGFLDIKYKDLIVKEQGNDEYSIYIKESPFNVTLSQNLSFLGFISSNYNFIPNHSFINPKIKLIDKNSKKDLLLGNFIYIIGQYKVNNIKEGLKEIFKSYNEINHIIVISSEVLKENYIDITYKKESNIISFEIPYLESIIYIELSNKNINKLTYKGKNYINNTINYTKLYNILNNIKK